VPRIKADKKSSKHLRKIKKGSGEYLALRIIREEHPMIDQILKAENRMVLKRDFGIALPDDTDWPTSYGRYSDRMAVLLEFIAREGQQRLQQKMAEDDSCKK